MDEQQSPEKRNEKNNDRDSSNTEFSFKYTEVGGISTNHYLIISYNSKKNIITSSKDVSGNNAMQKQSSESDEQELKEIGKANEFFRTKSDYPPEKEDENLMAHTLTVTVGGNIHTTYSYNNLDRCF